MLSILTIWMSDDFDDFRWSASTNLSIYSLEQIHATTNQLPAPALISKTMVPEVFASKWRDRLNSIPNEASGSMCIHGQEKRYKQVMRVPECLERLLPDLLMRCRVDEKHAEEHNMSCYTTSLSVVDFNSCLFANLRSLDVEEVDIVACSMNNGPEQERVGDLSMKPARFVQGKPFDFWSEEA